MSRENVEAFLEGNEAMRRGDVEALLGWVDKECVFHAARSAVEGVYRGHDGWSTHLADIDADVVGMQVEVQEYIDTGDYVVQAVRVRGRGRASGAPFEEHEVHLLRLRDGKATELREYRTVREALEAVGLSE